MCFQCRSSATHHRQRFHLFSNCEASPLREKNPNHSLAGQTVRPQSAVISMCSLQPNVGRYYCPLNRREKLNKSLRLQLQIMRQPNDADICVAVSPLCSVPDRDKCLSVAIQAAVHPHPPFWAADWGRQSSVTAAVRAITGKWSERKLNLRECRYLFFRIAASVNNKTFSRWGCGAWGCVQSVTGRVACSQLLPSSVSAAVRSQLGLHRSWHCCSLKAQRWPHLNTDTTKKKNNKKRIKPPQAMLFPPPSKALLTNGRNTNMDLT